MWAVTPPLTSQPAVEFTTDSPSNTLLYGFGDAFWGESRTSNRVVVPDSGGTITLACTIPNICAIHCALRISQSTDVSFLMGDTYSLRIFGEVNTDPLHPFAGVGNKCLKAILAGGGTESVAELPFAFLYLTACFGYAYNAEGQLKAYAHVFDGSNTFGRGSCGLVIPANETAAFADGMSMVVDAGDVEFVNIACHIGPFTESLPHMPERWSTKFARAGTRVASLLSRAATFSREFAAGDFAIADCGGHAEFVTPSIYRYENRRFPVSLAGQPEAHIAFIPPSDAWRSNCGFTPAQNARLAKLTVSAADLWVLIVPGGYGAVSFNDAEVLTGVYGNNEYFGVIDKEGDILFTVWDQLCIYAYVTCSESTEDYQATPLANVVTKTEFTVSVTVFGAYQGVRARYGNKVQGPNGFFGPFVDRTISRTLTADEAETFFNGGMVELDSLGGSIFVTASGS